MKVWTLLFCGIVMTILAAPTRAAFTPTSLTNLQLWLDASDLNGDGVANNPSSGTAVSTWVDKSGQVHDATQGTTANQPLVENTQINGQSTVRFDGLGNSNPGNDFLTTTGYRPSLAAGYTVFVVEQYATLNDGSYISSANGATGADGDIIRLRNNGGTPEVRLFSGGGFTDLSGMHGANTPGILAFTNSAISGGGAGTQIGYLDGSSLGSSSLSRSSVNTTGNDMLIGEGGFPGTGSPPYKGDIAEVIIYDRVLTSFEANQVGVYLQNKYTISGAYEVPEPASCGLLIVLGGALTRRWSRTRGI